MIDAALAFLEQPSAQVRQTLHREVHSIGGACAAVGAAGLADQASALCAKLTGHRLDPMLSAEVAGMLEGVKELAADIEAYLRSR